ncbi:MAG: flagellar hook-associated protein 3 [Treponemataceae bacterium]|nr:flagellar hook-associated protein 3 [Treponemataceae bacterium]
MTRITSAMTNKDLQRTMRNQESGIYKLQNQVTSQNRIQSLRDDPIAAGHLVRYESYLSRANQFEKNAQTVADRISYSETYMNQSLDIMQRVRELAVEGANGIYSEENLKNMAVEVDQLLQELISNANAVSADGTPLFAGISTNRTPFQIIEGPVKGSGSAMITNVVYNGSLGSNDVEVDENSFMNIKNSGTNIFWAENQQLYGLRDATDYTVPKDSVISIDGQDIRLTAGDNVYSIAAKINNSNVAVKASIDPVTNGLNLATTNAHQLWLEDSEGSTLSDLGIIKDSSQRAPYNLAESAQVSGGSLFDTVIALRNAMIQGDYETIGGKVLGSLDSGIDSLLAKMSESGAKYERALQNVSKAQMNQFNATALVAKEGDTDITQAITDLKMMQYVQQATLSTAGDLYSHSLLNFMK